jgi:hypothetical protein
MLRGKLTSTFAFHNQHVQQLCFSAIPVVLLLFPSLARSQQPLPKGKTFARLEQYVAISEAMKDSPARDRQGWLLVGRLSWQTSDEHLSEVETFALRPEAKPVRFCLAGLLIQRKRFDAAARVIVCELNERKGDRQYGMWKWWEYHFRERADYEELSLKITDGFLHQFEHGTEDERITIAEIFGLGLQEAHMTVANFKMAIHYPEK